MGKPHALLLPYPAQGHVIPLMELAHCLVDRGFKITFVNTEFTHKRLVAAALSKELEDADQIHLVTIPDGLGPGEDRNDFVLQIEAMLKFMPGFLETLIEDTNKESENKITCFIADASIAWSFEVAEKMGVRLGAFWPANAGTLATMLSIPKLIKEGIIGEDGTAEETRNDQAEPRNACHEHSSILSGTASVTVKPKKLSSTTRSETIKR
ncbi:UDP-glycosyltransferase 83A1 [Iris pallida]|uniref:UDP-glycosyltransferase 83A1 n=1 Tax=Iris pallida TaxID=29817 RepID=A0AAX6GGE0_IRIPA|nr:UDP-glycosyltransferase 83A1 [Iris pallida]